MTRARGGIATVAITSRTPGLGRRGEAAPALGLALTFRGMKTRVGRAGNGRPPAFSNAAAAEFFRESVGKKQERARRIPAETRLSEGSCDAVPNRTESAA